MEVGTKLLPLKMRQAIKAALVDFPASQARAQLIKIHDYVLENDETIADRIIRDHWNIESAFREAVLLTRVNAAKLEVTIKQVHCGHGVYKDKESEAVVFSDGSMIG